MSTEVGSDIKQMKLKYIDALRGLAIMGVLVIHCGHYGSHQHIPSLLQSVIVNGAHGVQLFYIASAFTLFLTLGNRRAPEKYPWLSFFIRRYFRIAPMYYIGICYYLWQNGTGARYWLGDETYISPWNILSNVIFVHGFNPYWITSLVPGGWSIAVEMLFYGFVPLLFSWVRNTQHAFIFVLIALFFRAVLEFILTRFPLIAHDRLWAEYLYMYFPSQLPVFALGILLYFIVRENYKLSASPVLLLITFFVLIAQFGGLSLLPSHFLFGIAFVVLAIALSKYEFKVFVNGVFVYIGRVSYSMYLVHFAVLFWLAEVNLVDYLTVTDEFSAVANYGIRLLVLTTITVVISTFFYRMVELPLQHLGRKLIYKLDQKTDVVHTIANVSVVSAEPNAVMPPRVGADDSDGRAD